MSRLPNRPTLRKVSGVVVSKIVARRTHGVFGFKRSVILPVDNAAAGPKIEADSHNGVGRSGVIKIQELLAYDWLKVSGRLDADWSPRWVRTGVGLRGKKGGSLESEKLNGRCAIIQGSNQAKNE